MRCCFSRSSAANSCISSKSLAECSSPFRSFWHASHASSAHKTVSRLFSSLRTAASSSSFMFCESSFWIELRASCILTFLSSAFQHNLLGVLRAQSPPSGRSWMSAPCSSVTSGCASSCWAQGVRVKPLSLAELFYLATRLSEARVHRSAQTLSQSWTEHCLTWINGLSCGHSVGPGAAPGHEHSAESPLSSIGQRCRKIQCTPKYFKQVSSCICRMKPSASCARDSLITSR